MVKKIYFLYCNKHKLMSYQQKIIHKKLIILLKYINKEEYLTNLKMVIILILRLQIQLMI